MAEALLTAFDKITREPFQVLGDAGSGTLLAGSTITQGMIGITYPITPDQWKTYFFL